MSDKIDDLINSGEMDEDGWVHLRIPIHRPYLEDLRLRASDGIYDLLPGAISDDDCIAVAMDAVAERPPRDGVSTAQAMAEALKAAKECRDYFAAPPPRNVMAVDNMPPISPLEEECLRKWPGSPHYRGSDS